MMEPPSPQYPEYVLKEIPKFGAHRANEGIFIDILRAAISPSTAYSISTRANLDTLNFKRKVTLLISKNLIQVDYKPLARTKRKDRPPSKPRAIYTTTARGRVAINYWIALTGIFEGRE